MKFSQPLIIVFFFLAFSIGGNAQQLKENELVVIKGEKYILHQVRTGETIYSITQRFNVDSNELVTHNPELSDGLKIGEILKIPYRQEADLSEKPIYQKGDPSKFIFHTISSRKETPYFIAKQYGITVEEIYAYNPEVQRFKKGVKLRIPRWQVAEEQLDETGQLPTVEKPLEQDDGDQLIKHEVARGETLYSISKKYNVSQSEILFYNPGAKDLKAGSIIYLPQTEQTVAEKTGRPDEAISQLQEDEQGPGESEGFDIESVSGKYFTHTIVSGETLWGIMQKYNVSEKELKRLNPVLESGFPAGVSIKIPVEEQELTGPEPKNEEAFIRHNVAQGETLFGLATKYNISIPEIRKFNPALENRNLVYGEVILIPRKPDEEIATFMEEKEKDSVFVASEEPEFDTDYYEVELPGQIPDYCLPAISESYVGQVYDVALFLPFYVYANDTLNREIIMPDTTQMNDLAFSDNPLIDELPEENDTLIEQELTQEMFHGFYRNSEDFLQFYEGVLLAIDSLEQEGMNIRLHVFDTQQNPDSIRKFIYSEEFLETDLIIGPVYPQVQQEVSEISAKNRIHMVSPLASQSANLQSNPYLFQINPSRDYLAQKTAEFIAEEYFNSNFIVFEAGDQNNADAERVVELTKERLYQSGYWGQQQGVNFSVYDFNSEGPFGFGRILSRTKENVVFVPSLNEGEISVALSNINNRADDYSITLIGFNRYEQFSSIDLAYYFNLKLHYIDPYWIDYKDPATIRFINKFKANFHTEPDNFGAQGYDVAFYFLNALKNYGKHFEACLPYMRTNLVQGNYKFEKVSPFGGYMNKGVSVINYQRDYDVVRKRIIGKNRIAQQ
jgi:LysM repeat protein/ABC-type branched-subunit amino acid transport system substrate-binding protein